MNDSITIFINELKNRLVSRYKLIGISSELILETRIFPKNSDIPPFLKEVFGVTYKEYVIKSRTLMLARVVRQIDNTPTAEIEHLKRRLYQFLTEQKEGQESIDKIEPIITSGIKRRKE